MRAASDGEQWLVLLLNIKVARGQYQTVEKRGKYYKQWQEREEEEVEKCEEKGENS